MDAAIKKVVDDLAAAGRRGDADAFRAALAEMKRRVAVTPPGGSIGPAMAFGTLAPAGDALGKALLELGVARALPFLDLLAGDPAAETRSIACRVLGHLGTRDPQAIVPLAHRLAADGSWEVREFIANALDELMGATQGDFVFGLMEHWVRDADANVRRVPTNALMRYGRRYPEKVIRLMGELLHDESRYVRENVVFCLSVMGAAKVQALGGKVNETNPPRLLQTLRAWMEDEDERTRRIIAKTLGRSWAKSCPGEALDLLRVLAADGRKNVRSGVVSSVKALAKSHPSLIEQAMEQWAQDANDLVRQMAMALQA